MYYQVSLQSVQVSCPHPRLYPGRKQSENEMVSKNHPAIAKTLWNLLLTIFNTNVKHRTICAAMKKSHSTPVHRGDKLPLAASSEHAAWVVVNWWRSLLGAAWQVDLQWGRALSPAWWTSQSSGWNKLTCVHTKPQFFKIAAKGVLQLCTTSLPLRTMKEQFFKSMEIFPYPFISPFPRSCHFFNRPSSFEK